AFELAHGGTIFFDEIGELPLELQAKLLRAIDRKEVSRVGGEGAIACDVRLLAATNRNLRTEVNAQRFRSDLFYRLAVVTVEMPPLRERLDDLPLLIEACLTEMEATDHPASFKLKSEKLLEELAGHPWPGNVRELFHYVERCLLMPEA